MKTRRSLVLVMVGVVLWSLVFVAPALAQGPSVPPLPNILNMMLPDFLLWLVSDAVLGALVALALIQLGIPEVARPIVMAAALGAASWLVRTLLPFVPPEFLTKTVWEIVFILLGMIPAWIGLRLAALQAVAMLRAAQPPARLGSPVDGRPFDPRLDRPMIRLAIAMQLAGL